MNVLWQKLIDAAQNSNRMVEFLKGDLFIGEKTGIELKIQPESLLFTIVSNSGGIIINRWLRILGNDSDEIAGVKFYNTRFKKFTTGLFLVACDVVGGLFAMELNCTNSNHSIIYFAPDTLEWESLNMSYEEFISWCFYGNIDEFYCSMRWKNWLEDVDKLDFNDGYLIYPFLWAKECNIETATKHIVPLSEIIELNFQNGERFANN